jgi:anti-sigma factor RsiW
MKTETQLKVQSYLDNELSPGDARKVGQMISSDAEARELYTELKETKEILVENEPVLKLQESREFYWSKIERSIASAERIAPPAASRPWWMRLVAPLAGAVALFAVLLSMVDRDASNPIAISQSLGSAAAAPMHEVEQQSTEVSTITFRSEAEGVTVVWVSNTQ